MVTGGGSEDSGGGSSNVEGNKYYDTNNRRIDILPGVNAEDSWEYVHARHTQSPVG